MLVAIFWLFVIGLIAWGVNASPIPKPFNVFIYILLIILAVYVLAGAFGVDLSLPVHHYR